MGPRSVSRKSEGDYLCVAAPAAYPPRPPSTPHTTSDAAQLRRVAAGAEASFHSTAPQVRAAAKAAYCQLRRRRVSMSYSLEQEGPTEEAVFVAEGARFLAHEPPFP